MRTVAHRSRILPASLIPVHGFGTLTITETDPQTGSLITRDDQLLYALACRCLIRGESEVGGVCVACALEQHTTIGTVTPRGLPTLPVAVWWQGAHCAAHYHPCSVPGCTAGGCARHMVPWPGRDNDDDDVVSASWVCPTHAPAVYRTAELADRVARHGRWRARLRSVLDAVFFGTS